MATAAWLKPFDDFLQPFTSAMIQQSDSRPHDPFQPQRDQMVDRQLRGRQITDPHILEAFLSVPRHEFVPPESQSRAYEDGPLGIGYGQTISQPYVVAFMLQLAQVQAGDDVLDIGGGSGYQAALLDAIGCQVVSVEIVPELAQAERTRLAELDYRRVNVLAGDVLRVLAPEQAFDAILAAAAPADLPQQLLEHLAPGGRLVMPVGAHDQQLVVIEKRADGTLHEMKHGRVSFVPMTGDND
jgi:protein-L-isoaspartate(D-aspartate) O-methyltransferase